MKEDFLHITVDINVVQEQIIQINLPEMEWTVKFCPRDGDGGKKETIENVSRNYIPKGLLV